MGAGFLGGRPFLVPYVPGPFGIYGLLCTMVSDNLLIISPPVCLSRNGSIACIKHAASASVTLLQNIRANKRC